MKQLYPIDDRVCARGLVFYLDDIKGRLAASKALKSFQPRFRSANIPLDVLPIPVTMLFLSQPCNARRSRQP
jgi:hypothetical protein